MQRYSQANQDYFVIEMLSGKKYGTFVEVGAYHSSDLSNTFLLEKDYGWTGVGFEIDPDRAEEYNENRKSLCIATDATTFDYEDYFDKNNFPAQIDYLQLDIEPAENTFKVLQKIPFSKYRFSAITYEHDLYIDEYYNWIIKEKQKKILSKLGYLLVAENVTDQAGRQFEDWWVDPQVVDKSIINAFSINLLNSKFPIKAMSEEEIFWDYPQN